MNLDALKSGVGMMMVGLCVLSFVLYNYVGKPTSPSGKKSETVAQSSKKVQEGFVFDKETQKPLAGVEVAKRGYNFTGSTEYDGHYYVEAESSDELIFKKEGYSSVIIAVQDAGKVMMSPLAKE